MIPGCVDNARPTTRADERSNAVVARAVDGDTIVASIGGVDEKVRLIGVNTPESVDPRRPVQCFGPEASHHTKELLPPGTPIRLVRDAEARDKYDRLLAYVYRARDDLFVNLELVTGGFAIAYPFPPNTAHSTEFAEAEHAATAASLGIWAACADPTKS
jgi:micrococcal nuclease